MELKQKALLQLSQLEEAVRRLEEAQSQPKNEFIRDSVIQRFEFCFELTWKLMQSTLAFLGQECASPRSCIRVASQNSLIDDVTVWFDYQEARNLSSHTYKENTAEIVYQTTFEFSKDVQKMIVAIHRAINS